MDKDKQLARMLELAKVLTEKQKRFCDLYVSEEFFGNGVRSYAEAYGYDLEDAKQYNICKASAYENLTKPYIAEYINAKLDEAGLNDTFVDKQLLFTITQHADLSAKMQAIREYNKIKGRIIDKTEIGKPGDFDVSLNLK